MKRPDTRRPRRARNTRASRSPKVRAPKRRLSHDAEQALTPRQLEILDALELWVLRRDFADVTMAEIARTMGCSLRTLYGIAPGKDELILAVLDRRLHRIGREAIAALEPEDPPLTRLRAYLHATNLAVQPTTAAFARDYGRVPGARALNESHANYIVAITRELLDEAVREGEIEAVETAAVAHVLGRLGNEFARPDMVDATGGSPGEKADSLAEILLRGLAARSR
ncbi:MAG: hypothetical protein CL908_00495 [Deltaproteobacteria bacterium]|nr:hypothetical protein [Deltaproteobacteria bacterium]